MAQQTGGEPEVRRALPAQSPGEPEVRRALPVNPGTTPQSTNPDYINPDWMQRVQPSPTPTPGPEPGFTPYRPKGRVEVAPTPSATSSTPVSTPQLPPPSPMQDEQGVIRLTPSTATTSSSAQDLERANGVYARKMYDYAVAEYEKFLISHPTASGRDLALFRLAESHRLLGNNASARQSYANLLKEFKTGEFAGAAAFRLGEYLYADKLYDAASTQFQTAAKESGSAEVKLSATYQWARCLDKLKRQDEALAKYREVAAIEQNNPYRNYAMLSMAELASSAGNKKEALENFTALANSSAQSAIRVEACIKAASLSADLGDGKKAAGFFEKALAIPEIGDWKPIAILGSLRTNYSLGNYTKVVTLYNGQLTDLPPDTRPEAMLLAANSFRQLGKPKEAQAIYESLITSFPDAAQSQDARFQKILNMYQLDDPQTLAAVDDFLKRSVNTRERAQAQLLKAETLFKKQDFSAAIPLYAEVAQSNLDDDIKGKALIKLGWCQSKTSQFPAAIETYTTYLKKFPSGASTVAATLQRGLARQETKDYPAALEDFEAVIKLQDAKERELALLQKALILGQQKDYKAMTDVFGQLLKEYPKSPAAAQANFWIGWAAYEEKNYHDAIEYLDAARKLDPGQYGERAGLRAILCYYYLQDRDGLKKAVDQTKGITVPTEVTRWLGRQSFAEGDYAGAVRYLKSALKEGPSTDPEVSIELAEALIRQGNFAEAATHAANYLQVAREPYSRARGLYAQARIAMNTKDFEKAKQLDEEGLLLQPEGTLNAEGRLLAGEIAAARGDYSEAAKTFLTVALLYDDPSITPRALEAAANAYRKAGNTLEAEKALHELQSRFPDFKKSLKITKETP